jgi:hypothetical protein
MAFDESLFSVNKHNRNEIIRLIAPEKNQLIFYEIFIRYSASDDDYDFEIRKIETGVSVFYNLVLSKTGNDHRYTYALIKEAKIEYDGEMTVFISLLEMICQKRSEEIKKNKIENYNVEKKSSLRILEGEGVFDSLISCFNKVYDNWPTAVTLLKNSRSSEVKQKIIREGFDKFDQTAQVQIISGMRREGLNKFMTLISKRLMVPEDKREDVKNIIIESDWMENNMWSNYDLFFSIGTGGKTKFASIFSHKDANDKFHFIVIEIQAEFELADDILIMTDKKSILGGIWSNSKDRITKFPNSIQPDDLKTVFSFFNLVVFKHVASQFGIQLELPK